MCFFFLLLGQLSRCLGGGCGFGRVLFVLGYVYYFVVWDDFDLGVFFGCFEGDFVFVEVMLVVQVCLGDVVFGEEGWDCVFVGVFWVLL